MSDIIRLLPDSVANQIAAGEVIQRPASVIKELVENAIDAGAQHIDVLVTDAGKSSIQVIDDGKGMSETDARLSFERHATSKIREAADLFALRTMGFRGEALASIAAVAQVELRTCVEGEELGTKLVIAGSKVESQEAISCPKGSNFCVKNLFFNVPARRKFLKSNQTELSNILTEFERIALVNPNVSFTLYHNDAELFNLPAIQLRQRIMGVFGKKINQDLLSLDVDTTMVRISGFVARPESARKKGARQYFFVNGRYMRHPYFHKAIMDAYEHLIPVGEQVSYFIYFDVDPGNIDVNIHPTKTEIKFENEQAIWQILAAAVKETLGKFNAVPSIDLIRKVCRISLHSRVLLMPEYSRRKQLIIRITILLIRLLCLLLLTPQNPVVIGNNYMRAWSIIRRRNIYRSLTRMMGIILRQLQWSNRLLLPCMIIRKRRQWERNHLNIISLRDALFLLPLNLV